MIFEKSMSGGLGRWFEMCARLLLALSLLILLSYICVVFELHFDLVDFACEGTLSNSRTFLFGLSLRSIFFIFTWSNAGDFGLFGELIPEVMLCRTLIRGLLRHSVRLSSPPDKDCFSTRWSSNGCFCIRDESIDYIVFSLLSRR